MEIDKEKLAAQANQLKGQAVELMSKVDVKKATGIADNFMQKVFVFGKLISALFMFLCLLTMAGSLVYWAFCGGKSVDVPDFDDYAEALEACEKASNDNSGDIAKIKEKNSVRSKYESDITKLIEVAKLESSSFEMYVNKLCGIEKGLRSDYIDGAIDFVKDAKKFLEKKGKADGFSGELMLGIYDSQFEESVAESKASEIEAKLKKAAALGTCGGALLGLVLFLIIPLLIQIEGNTRK